MIENKCAPSTYHCTFWFEYCEVVLEGLQREFKTETILIYFLKSTVYCHNQFTIMLQLCFNTLNVPYLQLQAFGEQRNQDTLGLSANNAWKTRKNSTVSLTVEE